MNRLQDYPRSYNLHGMTKHPIYRAWKNMKGRCQNPNIPEYPNYGGRGIQVCAQWQSFINFRDDMLDTWETSLMLERIDNEGNYEPDNCKWATRTEQNLNQRPHKKSSNLPIGVRPNGKGFQAQISIAKQKKYLGTFDTPEEASFAFEQAKKLQGEQEEQ